MNDLLYLTLFFVKSHYGTMSHSSLVLIMEWKCLISAKGHVQIFSFVNLPLYILVLLLVFLLVPKF